MKIVLFAAPGIMGPQVFISLFRRQKEQIACLVLATQIHSVPPHELLALAKQAGVPVLQPKDLKDPGFLQKLKAIEPDLILVASYDQIIPKEVRDIAKIASVNAHPSLLPKYRGACPEFWAIRNGDRETGVTLHHLADSFDSGDIILQEKITIAPSDTLGSLLYKVADLASNLFSIYLDQIHENTTLPASTQDSRLATKAPLVDQNDLRLNWKLSARELSNLIRAANPLGGSWTTFRQSHLKIWYAEPFEDEIDLGDHDLGELIPLESIEKLLVQTGQGCLEICCVQYALYYIIDGWHFALNAGIKKGESLGQVSVGV